MGLNDSYGQVKTQILLTGPLPSISKVYSMILQEEKRRSIGQAVEVVVEPTALYANNSNQPTGYQGGNHNYHQGGNHGH